jgi:hypothetical protein
MQHGDLETWSRTRILLILEGVLATITPITEKTHRWGSSVKTVGYDLEWHDVPLKRMITMAGQFDVAFDIVTFYDQTVADHAADYLQTIPIPYDTIESANFKQFCSKLRFRVDVSQIIDSDPQRLQHYGQLGRQVLTGGDFG